jgi:LPXTG-site transpeptidase (sortase) family protein
MARRGARLWLILLVASLLALLASAWWSVRPMPAIVAASVSGQLEDPGQSQPEITRPAESPTAAKRRTGSATREAPRGPGQPKMLIVSRLGISMPIVATTVDDRGQMELPARPSEIGWYAYGPKPGSAEGSAVLAGHVDSRRFDVGPLVALQRMRPGDVVVVQATSGPLTFQVDRVQLIEKRDLDLQRLFSREGRPVLRIVTCGGRYLPQRGGYQGNVVVTAHLR